MSTETEDRPQVTSVDIERYPGAVAQGDTVVVEEPLEIRLDDEPFAVLMRTPGDDRELSAGFLRTERVIEDIDDLASLEPCRDPNRPHRDNIMRVRLASGVIAHNLERARRRATITSSCGVCGKASIDAAMFDLPRLDIPVTLTRSFVTTANRRASATQAVFSQTGGLHGAVLFDLDEPDAPTICGRAEDVGRHNAVDKIVGQLLLGRQTAGPSALWLSGRAGFEVVQKAVVAGIPAMIAVGAPTSLAVELAEATGMTLIGFARGAERFNVYTGAIVPS